MADLEKTEGGCLIKEEFAKEICEHIDNGDVHLSKDDIVGLIPAPINPATSVPLADNEADTAIRSGQVGNSDDYARADHNHPIRRQDNPGDPTLTFTGTGDMTQVLILDRESDEESYAYKFRCRVVTIAGTGWDFITVPAIAGFQQPEIYGIGTYRQSSTSPQDDDGVFGAAPRGPYMGKEAHEWSSTRRVYLSFFRRDNGFITYVEFWVRYTRT